MLESKGEVVGNLVSGRLTGSGVEFFSFGEYFEALPVGYRFSLVQPRLRRKIAELAGVRFKYSGGYLNGFYSKTTVSV